MCILGLSSSDRHFNNGGADETIDYGERLLVERRDPNASRIGQLKYNFGSQR